VNAAGLRINELAEQQRRLQEALGQQQAQSERERAALRETFNSQMTEVPGLLLLQRSQQESIVTLVNEHYHQLRADLATQLISQEKQWQQRADIYEQQIAALQACLQEEIQARKVAAPSQILYAPPKEPQLPEELTKTNGATLHIQS
jgi:hypothetical protein